MLRVLLGAAQGGGGSFTPPRWVATATLLSYLGGSITKHASNPILPKGSSGQWDDFGVREICPVTDENGLLVTEADGIWAYYAGFPDGTGTDPWKIGLAKSTDNGVSWSKYGSNPVVSPAGSGWYQNDITQPAVVKLGDGSFVMLAAGRNASDTDSIGCLSSSDGLTWADEGQKLVLADFSDGAAMTEMGVPSLIHRSSGDWLCLFEALKTGATNGWRIFGATASDPTGTWTPLNSGHPLLSPTGAGWESVGVANPHVIENAPGEYAFIYNGIGTGADLQWRVGFAYGPTLTSMTRYSGNPILAKGASGQWDDQQTEASFLLKEPTTTSLRFYYQGFDDPTGSMQVGLATAG